MTTWRMRIACWISEAAHARFRNMQCSMLLYCNSGCTIAPQCYVTRTLPALLCSSPSPFQPSSSLLFTPNSFESKRNSTEECAGIAQWVSTLHRTDGPGIEHRWGRDFAHPSRPALGSTQSPVRWVPDLSRGYSSRGVALTIHPIER
jgi:hypothetical protein